MPNRGKLERVTFLRKILILFSGIKLRIFVKIETSYNIAITSEMASNTSPIETKPSLSTIPSPAHTGKFY